MSSNSGITIPIKRCNSNGHPVTGALAHRLRLQSQQETTMATSIFSLSPEMEATWNDLMGQMCRFVNDTNADVDMAYDWICEMLEIDSFVDHQNAGDSFYKVWQSCDNRNDIEYIM
jgi:hypothetical protein